MPIRALLSFVKPCPVTGNFSSRRRTRSPRSTRAAARDLDGRALRRRARARRVGRGPHPRRGARPARQPRVADRGRRRPTAPQPLVLYCASGARSAFAAKTLGELGYEDVVSLAGGFADWKRNGYDVVLPRMLSPEKRARYSRHIADPRDRRGGPAQAARLARSSCSARAASARRPRSTSRRPASATSGSSTPTSSTSRTCSGRSRTR